MPGTPLSLPEREEIAVALSEDRTVPWIAIGRRIGRHATTVMREVVANGGRARYRPALAERRADKERCRLRPSLWVPRTPSAQVRRPSGTRG